MFIVCKPPFLDSFQSEWYLQYYNDHIRLLLMLGGMYLYVHSHGVKFTFNDLPLLYPPAFPFFSPDMDPLKNLGKQLQVNTPDLLTPLSDQDRISPCNINTTSRK